MNRVFYGVWGILALTTLVFDIIILSNKFTWTSFLGAVCQIFILVFIVVQYRKLDREAARRKRQARRSKRYAGRFERSKHPFKMPKVGWLEAQKARRNDPNNWSV